MPSLDDHAVVIGRTQREHEHAIWEKLGLMLSACERRADEASRDVEAWLKCWFVKERVGEDFSGTVTGVASFGIFVTLDTLHVEGLVHVGTGRRVLPVQRRAARAAGERTGMRYRLTDKVQVQVSRVDLEARRIEFRLVQGTSFDALRKAAARGPDDGSRRVKKAAAPKPAALKGQTARCAAPRPRPAGPPNAAAKSQKVEAHPRRCAPPLKGAATDRQSRLVRPRLGRRAGGVALVFLPWRWVVSGGNEAFRVARAFTAILGACPIIARQSLAAVP